MRVMVIVKATKNSEAGIPDPMPGEAAVLELRPLHELEDFGENAAPEVRERDARLRAETGKQGS